MQEIERKFLVENDDFKLDALNSAFIVQAYINEDPSRTVRIRNSDGDCFLTIKGISSDDGLSRYEFEKSISLTEFNELLELCPHDKILRKRRYIIPSGPIFKWEVDVFENLCEPLTIAEIELENTDDTFIKPEWLGAEVTGNTSYYNVCLLDWI